MNPQGTTPRRRETFLVLFLAVGLAVIVTLFALLVSRQYFFAILAVIAGMILLGSLQYLLWGWPMKRDGFRGGTFGPRDGHG
jgi:hypothetical protein